MKKLLVLALAVLTLCGCGTEPPAETIPTAAETIPETQAPTEPPVINHEALEIYDLNAENVLAAAPMGEDILLFTGEPTTLVKLSGRKLEETASAGLDVPVDPASPAVRVSDTGVCYYDGSAVIFLDTALLEAEHISLPQDLTCEPVVSADLQTVFYAENGTIRAISRENGLNRLLRETGHADLKIVALHSGDTILECRVQSDDGSTSTLFLSAETGALCQEVKDSITLSTGAAGWFAAVSEDGYSQFLVGADGQSVLTLTPEETYSSLTPLTALNGVLLATYTEDATTLDFCSTETGTSLALMTLEGNPELVSIWGDVEENCVWLLLDGTRLCRWDLTESAVEDDTSRLGPYYTRENPDTEGLAALEDAAQALESQYHVEIHIAEDALAVPPAEYDLVSEYRVDALADGLDALSEALSRFTPEFLANTGKASADNAVHICLVRSIAGSPEAAVPDSADGLAFWDDSGNARIVLALGDTLAQSFCNGLAHFIDARVMSECSAFDNWSSLNPAGFAYDYDLTTLQTLDESAFTDTYAMHSPTADRAGIFTAAMTEGNEACFQSEILQKKLQTLCTGIRKAFGLTDSEDPLPWEQYLTE